MWLMAIEFFGWPLKFFILPAEGPVSFRGLFKASTLSSAMIAVRCSDVLGADSSVAASSVASSCSLGFLPFWERVEGCCLNSNHFLVTLSCSL